MFERVVTRRGASLTEVLIALVILTIGLTSVIALFPVGVNRVRNATLDTRTTIVARMPTRSFISSGWPTTRPWWIWRLMMWSM